MTTVGYGDIAPVGVPGRLFAVVWILTGLVIIAIFTGVITTSLTVVALSSNVKLYGTSVSSNKFFKYFFHFDTFFEKNLVLCNLDTSER